MAWLEARRISKHFGGVRAVDGVDLSVEAGELLVLLGPSGCGKSTLLRIVAGLEAPTGGELYIAGERIDAEVPPRARGVAMVFQSYALYPHKTVFANIGFPLEAMGVRGEALGERVRRAAARFGLQGLLDRRPRQLSGGERQRVALSRSVVRNPRLFLLDEPLSNLDAKLRAAARDELKEFQREVGTTTLYVTHDQAEAMGLGDRIAVMNQGRVHQVGTPREVYDDPADTFVATFVGTPPMNLVTLDGSTLLGFRPEHFLPAQAFGPGRAVRRFGFHVRRVEYLGADRLLYGTAEIPSGPGGPAGGSRERVIARLPATLPFAPEEGRIYEFAVPREALRFFDRASGLRRDHGVA